LRSSCASIKPPVIDIGLRKAFALEQQQRALGSGIGETVADAQLRCMAALAEALEGVDRRRRHSFCSDILDRGDLHNACDRLMNSTFFLGEIKWIRFLLAHSRHF
jgi:hypothetical protein